MFGYVDGVITMPRGAQQIEAATTIVTVSNSEGEGSGHTRHCIPMADRGRPRHNAGSHVVMSHTIPGIQFYPVTYAPNPYTCSLFCGVTTLSLACT